MALTLTTNPVGSAAYKIFAGFQPIEFVFKREDLAIVNVTSGTGGAKINHAGDLSAYLSAGDSVYLYSEGTNYTYDAVGTVLAVAAGEVTTDIPYIETGTGGYMNYFKNYYVELQAVHPTLSSVNLLPFSFEADGDAAGNVVIDVSLVNDLNSQRNGITQELISESVTEFEVKYRQVYTGSSEAFTLIDNKLLICLYATEAPEAEVILNSFDMPKLYLGYPAGIVVAHAGAAAGTTVEMTYKEKNIQGNTIASGTLGTLDSEDNGLLMWQWLAAASVEDTTKYIEFDFEYAALYDFETPDFASPDFVIS